MSNKYIFTLLALALAVFWVFVGWIFMEVSCRF